MAKKNILVVLAMDVNVNVSLIKLEKKLAMKKVKRLKRVWYLVFNEDVIDRSDIGISSIPVDDYDLVRFKFNVFPTRLAVEEARMQIIKILRATITAKNGRML